jgi:hypothetical protein
MSVFDMDERDSDTSGLLGGLVARLRGGYNPPLKALRPFEADYPRGTPTDAGGRLTHDLEGRPLTAKYVVGRRMVGGEDQALPATEFDALATATTGRIAEALPSSKMGQDFGTTAVDQVTGRPRGIWLRDDLPPGDAAMVYAHELGHAIDQWAGQIPTAGLRGELRSIYNSLNNPHRRPDGDAPFWMRFTPRDQGYGPDGSRREYIVEAIRAYLADPNYLKTVAPGTAARISEYVNSHPELSKIIQFNTLAGPVLFGSNDPEQPTSPNGFDPEHSP